MAEHPQRVTVLYDAFGPPSELIRDWGFAALIEYGGRRVLFDTGNDAKVLEHNADRLGVDLAKLDAVVISHRHGDHTSGLTHVLAVNPDVRVLAPQEGAFFRSTVPRSFLKPQPGLPSELRYFGGSPPAQIQSGTPWESARFTIVTGAVEILPGFHVLTTRSQRPGTLEMNELSLAIRTPRGLAVVVGCSHPGIERMLEDAVAIDRRLYTVVGGLHLVTMPRAEVERTASALADSFAIERIAPCHCTSELGFAVLLERFGDRFDRVGVGGVLALP
jgi:7,8-dihydropterin-6-yl-methyl-4-(beta-D-ribofuranosyl)aminobenzene 5'-phosphate synthase